MDQGRETDREWEKRQAGRQTETREKEEGRWGLQRQEGRERDRDRETERLTD